MNIDWEQFSKQELISILRAMEERAWIVEPLDLEQPMTAIKECSCDPVDSDAPLPIQELCRVKLERANRDSPLKRLLRSPRRLGSPQRRQA